MSLIRKFAVMAVLGSMVCGVLVAGCGGGDESADSGDKMDNTAVPKDKTPDVSGDE